MVIYYTSLTLQQPKPLYRHLIEETSGKISINHKRYDTTETGMLGTSQIGLANIPFIDV